MRLAATPAMCLAAPHPAAPPQDAIATSQAHGGGALEPLAAFTTNSAGSAIVNAVGPIRQIVSGETNARRRYVVIASDVGGELGRPVQAQVL